MTLKGLYGKPRKLVRDAVILVCKAIEKNAHKAPVKFVLMNTAGNQNRDLHEPISFAEKIALGFFRYGLPPHADNEQAADHLRVTIGQDHTFIQWAVVRPDTLINKEEVSPYTIHASPVRSAIFDPGKTSRINVGDFMAKLIVENEEWDKWKGKMPVIYNLA